MLAAYTPAAESRDCDRCGRFLDRSSQRAVVRVQEQSTGDSSPQWKAFHFGCVKNLKPVPTMTSFLRMICLLSLPGTRISPLATSRARPSVHIVEGHALVSSSFVFQGAARTSGTSGVSARLLDNILDRAAPGISRLHVATRNKVVSPLRNDDEEFRLIILAATDILE